MRKKRILFACIKHPYGKTAWGLSYEHIHFLNTLQQMEGIEVKSFDWLGLTNQYGKKNMQKKLLHTVDKWKPDLVFFSIVWDEFDKETLEKLQQVTTTLNWFFDEIGRFHTYTKNWASYFTWIISMNPQLISAYKKIGCRNIIISQIGVNEKIFKKLKLHKKYDVVFAGMAHSNRKRLVAEIKRAHIDIQAYGEGWKSGFISQKEQIKIINQSKIVLNFTDISFGFRFGKLLPWFLQPTVLTKGKQLINGKIFEIPACGSFMLTSDARLLNRYYTDGKEIVVYTSLDELIRKIRYYLVHDEERERIALAGYKKTLKSHTYKKRFTEIFKKIGIY